MMYNFVLNVTSVLSLLDTESGKKVPYQALVGNKYPAVGAWMANLEGVGSKHSADLESKYLQAMRKEL